MPDHSEERGTPPKRRYSLDLAMQGDGPQAMADALYDIATDLLHGSFPGLRHQRGYDVTYRAELVENDPTMTHERYAEELEAYLFGNSEEADRG